MTISSEDLFNRFTYHAPKTDEVVHDFAILREAALEFARLVVVYSPESREQSLALTKIEEAVMWANAAIARHQEELT